MLTTCTGDVQVSRAMKAGAQAHLLKNLPEELLKTIRGVHNGKNMLPTIES